MSGYSNSCPGAYSVIQGLRYILKPESKTHKAGKMEARAKKNTVLPTYGLLLYA